MARLGFPDELLDTILAHYCHIPTGVFFSNLNVSSPNFSASEPRQPGHAVLLVSRRFYRFALPHFYVNVIIRSLDQARALRCSMHLQGGPQKFLLFTRRIRIDDGHIAAVNSLLKLVGSQLEDLCIRVRYPQAVKTNDEVPEDCIRHAVKNAFPALTQVNPLRVGAIDWAHGREEITSETPILETIQLKKFVWDRLHTVYLPYQSSPSLSTDRHGTAATLPQDDFIIHLPNLRTIHLPNNFSLYSIIIAMMPAEKRRVKFRPLEYHISIHGPRDAPAVSKVCEGATCLSGSEQNELPESMFKTRMLTRDLMAMKKWRYLKGLITYEDKCGCDWFACSCGQFPCV